MLRSVERMRKNQNAVTQMMMPPNSAMTASGATGSAGPATTSSAPTANATMPRTRTCWPLVARTASETLAAGSSLWASEVMGART